MDFKKIPIDVFDKYHANEGEQRIRDIARECAELIEKSGINAYDALSVPDALYNEICYDLYNMIGNTSFLHTQPENAKRR